MIACTPEPRSEVPVELNDSSPAEFPPDSSRRGVHIELDKASPDFGLIEIGGLEPAVARAAGSIQDWEPFFRLDAYEARADTTLPPMLGRYSVGDSFVRFSPRFRLSAGLRYRVTFDERRLRARHALPAVADAIVLDTVFTVPANEVNGRPELVRVYPSADSLPANLLKFYLHFSRPMAEGRAYEHIRLIDLETNQPVEAPFVEIIPELWDPERRRFTLLFDPGRIKRMVGTNLELGPPLQSGNWYRLEVDSAWNDVDGQLLARAFEKPFFVTEADREELRAGEWEIDAPNAGTTQPVVLSFPEPLDHALLQRLLIVYDAKGAPVSGQEMIDSGEKRWSFVPDEVWESGSHTIEVATILEDVAGNTLQSLFDVDLDEAPPSEVREAESTVSLHFEAKATR